jgi:hypothetical protein
MNLPTALLTKSVARLDSLIAEGKSILDDAKEIPPTVRHNEWSGRSSVIGPAYKKLDWRRFVEWRTKAATLLARIVPKNHVHRATVEAIPTWSSGTAALLQGAISLLKGVKDDLEQGFFDDLSLEIETEIASDYMGQAECLLKDGQWGKFDHVPAAVLAGAVLEKALRSICSLQQPPVPVLNSKGEPKTLSPLIDDLKKAGAFNELKAKQLRTWAGIRNHAAHGEFDQFNRSDVEAMIPGIKSFLSDYMK